jgi:hypothetical protein
MFAPRLKLAGCQPQRCAQVTMAVKLQKFAGLKKMCACAASEFGAAA